MNIIYNKLTRQFNTAKEFTTPPNKGVRTNGAGLWPEGEYILLNDDQTRKFHEYQQHFATNKESWGSPSKDCIEWVFGDIPSREGLGLWENNKTMAEEKRKETLAEQKLREEYEKMKKWATHDPGAEDKPRLEELQYTTPAAGMHKGRSVNTLVTDYQQKHGNVNSIAGGIKPAEALDLAIKRTLASGAPVNNMGFYDEINWHLQTLGTAAQLPIVIKEALTKLLKKGIE